MNLEQIYITPYAYQRLMYYTACANKQSIEVSGFGRISETLEELRDKEEEDQILTVENITILTQECSGGSTDIDHKAISEFMIKLRDEGDDIKYWKVWWHTHPSGTFWSGIDENAIEGFHKAYRISLEVSNKTKEVITRFDLFDPFRHKIENLKLVITLPEYDGLKEEIEDEFEEKVEKKTYGVWKGNEYQGGIYEGGVYKGGSRKGRL